MSAGPHTAGVVEVVRGTELHAPSGMVASVRGEYGPLHGDLPDADRLAACWNCLHGLSLDQVERMGRLLDKYNADEVEDFLRDEGL